MLQLFHQDLGKRLVRIGSLQGATDDDVHVLSCDLGKVFVKIEVVAGKDTLWDFYNQIQQVKKMGNIKDLASMIPGMGKVLKDVDMDNASYNPVLP